MIGERFAYRVAARAAAHSAWPLRRPLRRSIHPRLLKLPAPRCSSADRSAGRVAQTRCRIYRGAAWRSRASFLDHRFRSRIRPARACAIPLSATSAALRRQPERHVIWRVRSAFDIANVYHLRRKNSNKTGLKRDLSRLCRTLRPAWIAPVDPPTDIRAAPPRSVQLHQIGSQAK